MNPASVYWLLTQGIRSSPAVGDLVDSSYTLLHHWRLTIGSSVHARYFASMHSAASSNRHSSVRCIFRNAVKNLFNGWRDWLTTYYGSKKLSALTRRNLEHLSASLTQWLANFPCSALKVGHGSGPPTGRVGLGHKILRLGWVGSSVKSL